MSKPLAQGPEDPSVQEAIDAARHELDHHPYALTVAHLRVLILAAEEIEAIRWMLTVEPSAYTDGVGRTLDGLDGIVQEYRESLKAEKTEAPPC